LIEGKPAVEEIDFQKLGIAASPRTGFEQGTVRHCHQVGGEPNNPKSL